MAYLAAACAQSQLPVVLTSKALLQSSGFRSRARVPTTTPAKQSKIFTLPRASTVSDTARSMACSFLTSTSWVTTLAAGKSNRRVSIACRESSRLMSKRDTPDAPCSRRFRATSIPRQPAPPVTTKCDFQSGIVLTERAAFHVEVRTDSVSFNCKSFGHSVTSCLAHGRQRRCQRI